MNTLLYLLFVGVSLQTHYFYQVSMPAISVVSLALMTAIFFAAPDGIRLPFNAASAVVVAYLVILFWSAVALMLFGDAADTKRLLGFLIAIAGAVAAVSMFRRVSLEATVRTFLVVHVFFFYLQAVVYYGSGYLIDYLAPITGEAQRTHAALTLPFLRRLIRPVGLFGEPGTYATFVAPFVALSGRWYGKSMFGKRLFWLGLFSLFLTLSIFGILFGALIFLFSRNVRRGPRIAGLALGAILSAPYLHWRFFVLPALGVDSGFGFRRVFFAESLRFLWTDPIGFVFGSSLLVLDPRAAFTGAFNDVGLVFFLFHFAGPLLTLALCAALGYAAVKTDGPARLALLIVILSKHSLFAPFFPFTLAALLWPRRLDAPVDAIVRYGRDPSARIAGFGSGAISGELAPATDPAAASIHRSR